MPGPSTAILWLRRDLRVHDHPALAYALGHFDRVVPLFVVDDRLLRGRWRSANRLWFLAGALRSLQHELRERDSALTLLRGRPAVVVPGLAHGIGAEAVVVTRDLTSFGRGRDEAVAAALAAHRIPLVAGRGLLVHEPEEVSRPAGGPFTVFSPFHRRWLAAPMRPQEDAPATVPTPGTVTAATDPDPAGLLDDPTPTASLALMPEPTETAARQRLERWVRSEALREYATGRDRLDLDGTSRLSQDLRFGLLSPVEVLARVGGDGPGPERFRSELAWRDFYAHLLWHLPRVAREAFRADLDGVAWSTDAGAIDAWTTGRTGYPVSTRRCGSCSRRAGCTTAPG